MSKKANESNEINLKSVNIKHSYLLDKGHVSKIIQINDKKYISKIKTSTVKGDGFNVWWKEFINSSDKKTPSSAKSAKPVRYLDLFSSVGGLTLGVEQAIKSLGFKPVPICAVDVDAHALDVYKKNHGDGKAKTLNISVSDIVSFGINDKKGASFKKKPVITKEYREILTDIDLIIAGPPCQGHSTLNNHSRSLDPRNALYLTVPAIAVALGAKMVIIENVPNVVNDKGNVVETTISLLKNNGYNVSSSVLRADDLGWAQTRKRFFLVATKGSIPVDLEYMKQALKHVPNPSSWLLNNPKSTLDSKKGTMNTTSKMSNENISRINWLFDEREHDLPDSLRPDCHKNGNTYPSSYGRMYWDKPCPTLTTGFQSPGRGRFIHPKKERPLTPREASRIQGFPNWFDFRPDTSSEPQRTHLAKWIGDAVPSIMGYVAGLSVLIPYSVTEDGTSTKV